MCKIMQREHLIIPLGHDWSLMAKTSNSLNLQIRMGSVKISKSTLFPNR